MKHFMFLVVAVFLFAFVSSAQVNPANYTLIASPFAAPNSQMALASSTAAAPAADASAAALFPALPSPAMPQAATRVYETYYWQASISYTFFRFYETRGVQENMNGFNYSMVYYFLNWLGADGEFLAAFGSQTGTSSHFLFGGGGPRFRWSGPRGLELWGHGLVGYSHFTPQTPLGGQSAFAYELGGGVDLTLRNRHWAYRAEGDVIGSRFFNTYQFSPTFSGGIVFKF